MADGAAGANMLNRKTIPSLDARAGGHRFVVYGDSCSGVAGAANERNLRQVNAAIQALDAAPAFICFLGDEIMGLSSDPCELRRQWRHFLDTEMAWLDRDSVPLYHTTGNHTVYDAASEAVFREAMTQLPWNEGRGLSYMVRRGDLLLVFVDTMAARCGGEGAVDVEWLENALRDQGDARYKLVFGHHPVWAVNGYHGDYQRNIEGETGRRFWESLRRHGALAYFCSHILAFDAQLHDDVLQICTAGAGTAHRMPEGAEYLHFAQVALDEAGLRYQTIDRRGELREWLCCAWNLPPAATWARFDGGVRQRIAARLLKGPRASALDCLGDSLAAAQ